MNILHSQRNRKSVTILHTADLHLTESREDVTGDDPPGFGDSCTILKALIDAANQLLLEDHNGNHLFMPRLARLGELGVFQKYTLASHRFLLCSIRP